MAMTEEERKSKHNARTTEYNRTLDRITVKVDKTTGAMIRAAAAAAGQPLQRFILDIVTEHIGTGANDPVGEQETTKE